MVLCIHFRDCRDGHLLFFLSGKIVVCSLTDNKNVLVDIGYFLREAVFIGNGFVLWRNF